MDTQRFSATVCAIAGAAFITGCTGAGPNPNLNLAVDGKKQDIAGAVSCSSHSAGTSIQVGQLPSGIRIQLEPEVYGEPRVVGEVNLVNSTGTSLVLDSNAP